MSNPPSNAARRAYLKALHARVGEHHADQKTTVMDYAGADLGWDRAATDAVVAVLMKAGLVTTPTKERVIGLSDLGLAVARRREQAGEDEDEYGDDEDE